MKRRIAPVPWALLATAVVGGCGPAPAPQPQARMDTVQIASPSPAPRPDEAARELLARAIAIHDPAWRAAHRAKAEEQNAAARLAPSPEQLALQLEAWQTQKLEELFPALARAGGPEVAKFLLAIAENSLEPSARRESALAAFDAITERDHAWDERRRMAGDRVAQAVAAAKAPKAGAVTNASEVVASMAPAFRRCYNHALRVAKEPPADPTAPRDVLAGPDYTAKIRVTTRIDAEGNVASVSSNGSAPADLIRCTEEAVRSKHFVPPEGGGATIVIPVTYVQQP